MVKEQVAFSRLKIGQSHHSGSCVFCNERETVEHFLVRCGRYDRDRAILLNRQKVIQPSMPEILKCGEDEGGSRCIVWLLKATGLFDKI